MAAGNQISQAYIVLGALSGHSWAKGQSKVSKELSSKNYVNLCFRPSSKKKKDLINMVQAFSNVCPL